jgi:hypothetical protein
MLIVTTLAVSMSWLPGMSVASAQPTLTYTGDILVPACNVCLEVTLEGVDPLDGYDIEFIIQPVLGGGPPIFFDDDIVATDEFGVARLCIGELDTNLYLVGAVIVIDGTPDWGTLVTSYIYVYKARVTGGGQIIADPEAKKKDQLRITFGVGAYNFGVYGNVLDSCEVTFQNVGDDDLDKQKFVATDIIAMECFYETFDEYTDVLRIRLDLVGELNGVPGYSMRIPCMDLGEPSSLVDSIRFRLYEGTNLNNLIYDSTASGDFDTQSQQRTFLGNGNLQLECCD